MRYEIVKAVTEFLQFYNGQCDKDVFMGTLKSKNPINIRNEIITDYEHPKNIKFSYQIMISYNAKSDKPLPGLKQEKELFFIPLTLKVTMCQ